MDRIFGVDLALRRTLRNLKLTPPASSTLAVVDNQALTN
jgi:hypothetical protein